MLAQRHVEVVFSRSEPPVLAVMKELQDRCIEARAAFADEGVGLPPLHAEVEAQLDTMQSELRFWWLYLKCTAEQRGWQAQSASKPLGGADGVAVIEWSQELRRRARRLSTRLHELLKVEPGMMGQLPTPAEVSAAWGQPDPTTPAMRGQGGGNGADDASLRSDEGLAALRAAVVPRVLRNLHQALLETGKLTGETSWLHESFGVSDLLADDRYRLYECFDKAGLTEMLQRFRSSALEMLAASG